MDIGCQAQLKNGTIVRLINSLELLDFLYLTPLKVCF